MGESEFLGGIQLAGPWPQPVTGAGRIEFTSERSQRLRADVVDASGRQILRLFDAPVRAGERRAVRCDAASWAAGVYFVRVAGDGNAFVITSYSIHYTKLYEMWFSHISATRIPTPT